MKQYQCDILDLLVQQVNVSGGGFRKNIGNFIKPKSKNKVVNVVSTISMNARVANKVVNIVSAHANSNVFEKHLSEGVMLNGVPLHEYDSNDGGRVGNSHYSTSEDESKGGDSSSNDCDDDKEMVIIPSCIILTVNFIRMDRWTALLDLNASPTKHNKQ